MTDTNIKDNSINFATYDYKEINSHINALSSKYNLTSDAIVDTLQMLLSEVLTTELGYKVLVNMSNNEISLYGLINQHGIEREFPLSIDKIKKYHVKKMFELFTKKLSLKEQQQILEKYKFIEESIYQGIIIKKNNDYYLVKLTTPIKSDDSLEIIAYCDKRFLYESDIASLPSQELWFQVDLVEVEELDGVYRLVVKLRRRSNGLPLELINRSLRDNNLRLKIFYRGKGIIKIRTSRKIPKSVLEMLHSEFKDEKFIFKLFPKNIKN